MKIFYGLVSFDSWTQCVSLARRVGQSIETQKPRLQQCVMTSLVLLWTSAFVIAWGAHTRIQSPHYDRYVKQFEEDTFAPMVAILVVPHYTAAIVLIDVVAYRRPFAGLFLAAPFALFCFGTSIAFAKLIVPSYQWGFLFLALGYSLFIVGLTGGAVGVIGLAPKEKVVQKRPN
jgi:hypothetical protein